MIKTDEELLEGVAKAFSREPIAASTAFHDWGRTYSDAEAYRQQIDGKAWDQLDRKYLVERSDALGFLGTQALVAVLPVYLNAVIEDGVWSPATESLTVILAKPTAERDVGLGTRRFDALVDALTPQQRAAIADLLVAVAQRDAGGSLGRAAQRALDDFWMSRMSSKI